MSGAGVTAMRRFLLAALLALVPFAAQAGEWQSSPPSSVVSTPSGRLTLTSGAPVMTGDVTAATTVYYTPYVGNMVPIFGGAGFAPQSFAELSLALDSTTSDPGYQAANSLYDDFLVNDTGTVRLCTGPAWTKTATITVTIATPAVVSWTGHGLNEGDPVVFSTTIALPTGITAGTVYFVGKSPATDTFNISTTVANAAAGTFVATSGSQSGTQTATNGTRARGTGAGTTELQRLNGIWLNKNAITCRWGSATGNTVAVPASQATYLGTMLASANGQVTVQFTPAAASGGSNNIVGLWNAYNRVSITSREADSTSSWTYNATTWRAANGNAANRITWLDGLAQSTVRALLLIGCGATSTPANTGVVLDSTTATPVMIGKTQTAAVVECSSRLVSAPLLGARYAQAMEQANTAATITLSGNANMALMLDIEM